MYATPPVRGMKVILLFVLSSAHVTITLEVYDVTFTEMRTSNREFRCPGKMPIIKTLTESLRITVSCDTNSLKLKGWSRRGLTSMTNPVVSPLMHRSVRKLVD